jgi:hypothetical protein
MPRKPIEYLCLLISPSDVSEERGALTNLVNNWNAQIGRALGVRVELVRWESHATPDMSDSPQNVINTQLVEDCDLGIAVFWSRLGTPTSSHPSGSIEEIDKLRQRGVRVLVYFSERPIPQNALRDEQFAKLQEERSRFQEQGLLATYSDISNLREQVQLHLTNVITQLLAKDRDVTTFIPASGTVTAPTPDVRVTARGGVSILSSREHVTLLIVTVQNHSPITVFLGSVFIETKTGEQVIVPRDFITGEWQKRRELRSGESFSFHIFPQQIQEFSKLGLICAAVRDDIDRVYRSTETELQTALEVLLK